MQATLQSSVSNTWLFYDCSLLIVMMQTGLTYENMNIYKKTKAMNEV